MKLIAFLLCGIAFTLASAGETALLSRVQTVYLLPMGNGLDQYLANRLTNSGVLQVVTDPKRADAIFTDRLGEGFERRLEDLFPAAADEEAVAQDESTPERPPVSAFQRGKGTVFLVDTASRAVIWSTYEKPRNFTPDQLDRTAHRIAERLRRDIAGR